MLQKAPNADWLTFVSPYSCISRLFCRLRMRIVITDWAIFQSPFRNCFCVLFFALPWLFMEAILVPDFVILCLADLKLGRKGVNIPATCAWLWP